ncbi:MAG: hypothetical protein HYR85_24430 [Planctomycetes bacterium]|nr:hypothetical protein [Planctomycetota bacterium]
MKTLLQILTVVAIAFAATACKSVDKAVDWSPFAPAPLISPDYVTTVVKKYSAPNAIAEIKTKIDALPDPNDKAQQKQRIAIRNDSLNELLLASDSLYEQSKVKLYTFQAESNIGFDILNLGLTGSAAVLGSAATKSVLSGIATFSQGYEASVDKNLFAEKSISALSNTMDADRAEILSRIVAGMVQDTFDYGLDEGVRDVLAYHRAGALVSAISQLASSSGTVKEAREGELRGVRERAK